MSISRAFTTRRVKQSIMLAEKDSSPQRSSSMTRGTRVGSIRYKISAPVELVHTTNMLSYNAPDLFPKAASSAISSQRSDDDLSDSAGTSVSTPPTSPDIESYPKRSLSPEPNHLSCYFALPGQTMTQASQTETPVIPQRAVSHTKKSYDSLVRQRSTSRLSEQSQRSLSTKASFSFSRTSSSSTSTTASSHISTPPQHKTKVSGSTGSQSVVSNSQQAMPAQPQLNQRKELSQSQHPFGLELAQVSEIAEEYGVKEQLNELEAEEQELVAKGLNKFSADDYLGEIQGLLSTFFAEARPMATAMWI